MQVVYEDSAVQVVEIVGLAVGGAIIVGGVTWVVVVRWLQTRRERSVRTDAEAEGWQWQQNDQALVDLWPLAPFGIGRRRATGNVLRLQHRGRSAVVFDYCSVGGHREESRRPDVSVNVLTLPGALPTIQVGPNDAPEGLPTRAFGFDDMSLPHDEVAARWRFRCDNNDFADALFDDRMLSLLRESDGWTWGLAGPGIAAFHPGRFSVRNVGMWLDRMCSVADRIPDEVWRRYEKG